jgi:general secretion pathway protein G
MRFHRKQKRCGFSLLELMAVIVIIGLLAGVVTLSVRSYMKRAYRARVETDLAHIVDAITTFEAAFGRIPTSSEGLDALVRPTAGFVHGILTKSPIDPWRHPYQYNQPGRDGVEFEVICFGSDGAEGGEGTAADISSLDLSN